MASGVPSITPPEGQRESRRYRDYFNRSGVTEKSVLESVELTHARSNVYFNDLYDWMAGPGNFNIACGAGCGYCCHTMVSLLPPEAFYLAQHIETAFAPDVSKALQQRIVDHDRKNRGLSAVGRYEGHIPCPMLDPDTWFCRVHDARPLTCRSLHSSNKPACVKAYEERDAYIPTESHQLFFENARAYHEAFSASLSDHGIDMQPLELNAALATIWTEGDAMARWLAGEKVFQAAYASKMKTDRAPSTDR
jgi:Fe-S-cluster containining protein